MLPIVPPATIRDIAHERYRKVNTVSYQMHIAPDTRRAEDALAPDPVFMGFRALIATGPIGALVKKIDRMIEAREDRRYGVPAAAKVTDVVVLPVAEGADTDLAA